MKFDVIIGNPPYQLNIGNEGGNSARAQAIYHLFVDKAIDMNPKYISMIIPSRWMTRSAGGVPDTWVDKMILGNKIKEMHDFMNSEDCFDDVMIRGGVNFFLWDKDHNGKCEFYQHDNKLGVKSNIDYLNSEDTGIVIRDINALSIINKIKAVEKNYIDKSSTNFSSMVGPGKFFVKGKKLQSNWKGYSTSKSKHNNIKYYMSALFNGTNVGWININDILKNRETIKMNKIYINSAGHNEKFGGVLANPMYGEPNSVCSETYLVIGYDHKKHNFTKYECYNIMSYIRTKFFRFLVDSRKSSYSCTRAVYEFVPLQDWSKPWTDEELYKKYKLTQEEIDYIENNIDPMPASDD